MSPILLTLYGEERLGYIEAIIAAAVTNIIGDVKDVASGAEDKKTAILNTLVPYIGKFIGQKVWPTSGPTASASAPPPSSITANLDPQKQQAIALGLSALPLVGSVIIKALKG